MTALARRLLAAALVATVIIVTWYVVHIDRRVGERLGVGGHAHSRFFAAPFRILPGTDLEHAAVFPQLEELGYRADPKLARPGTWRRRPGGVEIRLRAFTDTSGALPERHARLDLDGTTVRTIVDVPTGTRQSQVTLEPALLDVTWNGAWERRRPVRLADVPRHVRDAVLAAEDVRFYGHHGVDLRGVARALWVNLHARRAAEGASTLTQQLAKNFFLTPRRTLRRKVQEALIALLIERRLSKDAILELYLNEVYLGRTGATSVVGVGEAARTFFGKRAADLTLAESATIAGIIRAPNANSPLRSPERARRRRNAILRRMLRAGFITAPEEEAARRAPVTVTRARATPVEGLYFLEQVRREVEARLGAGALAQRRLDVYTTLDPRAQHAAERGVGDALAALEAGHRWLRGRKTELEAAFVLVDPRDGAVRALVGGRDFARSPFDRAVSAHRQSGSTFKPFVYLAAFQEDRHGITPSTLLDDRPLSLEVGPDRWQPVNYDDRFRGAVTVRTALEQSLNVPTVRLSQQIGVEQVARTAAAAGWHGDLPRVPALALGVAETSLLELAASYTVFPRAGTIVGPTLVRGVRAADGTVVVRTEAAAVPAADARAAYLVHHLLEGVVDRGTARALRSRGFRGALAGKTGTTNEYRDAWFVGYTPDLVGAAWVGFDDGRPLRLSSAATALEVWATVMRPILRAAPPAAFDVPPGIVFRDVDPASGLLPAAECPRTIREAYLAGTEPRVPCSARPGLLPARRGLEEPFEEPIRILGDWMRQAMRMFDRDRRRARPPVDDDAAFDRRWRRQYPNGDDAD